MKKVLSSFIVGMLVMTSTALADRVKLLDKDINAMQARADIVGQAQNEVLAEYFSVWNDSQSLGGLVLLLEAAKRGRDVKVIIDGMSSKVPMALLTKLQEASIDSNGVQKLQIKFYNKFSIIHPLRAFHRDHAKLLIADGDKPYGKLIIGGRNIGDKYFANVLEKNPDGKELPSDIRRPFKDLDVITEGQLAKDARESFLKVWNNKKLVSDAKSYKYSNGAEKMYCDNGKDNESCRNEKRLILKKLKEEEVRMTDMLNLLTTNDKQSQIVYGANTDWLAGVENYKSVKFRSHDESDIVTKKNAKLNNKMYLNIKETQEKIDILNPYLIPPEELKDILKEITSREKPVKIRIITNSLAATDNWLVQIAYQKPKVKEALAKMGIEIYEYKGPETLHAKGAVIDNKTVLIGTYNLDNRSAHLNREVGIRVTGEIGNDLVKDFNAAFENILSGSRLVAQGGVVVNEDQKFKGLSKGKVFLFKLLSTVTKPAMFLIEPQL